jgi:zinc/manganese transport system substrate-binding protein
MSGRSIPAPPALLLLALAALALSGCNRSGGPPRSGDGAKLQVVAAENFWGSVAAQLGGAKVRVRSIIVSPGTDPHSYEPSAQDARTIAGAQLAIVNGIGYDNWAPRLLAASPLDGRAVLNVGSTLGMGAGENPHQWYSPHSLQRVIAAIVADYDRLDPGAAAYFATRERGFQAHALARYDELRRQIRARYAGVPVGFSESIFQPLGEDLRLRLLTPEGFAKAVAEGTEVSAADKQTVDTQARQRLIKIWIVNSQNVTPDVQRVNEAARQAQIPIATVSETLTPASDSFEQWQVAQLEGIERALHEATGR